MDTVEVAPRFSQPQYQAPPAPMPVPATPPPAAAPADEGFASGLFTSIAENKFIIGLTIVLILVAIGLAWYFGFSKSATAPMPNAPTAGQPNAGQPNAPTGGQPNAPAGQPTAPPSAPAAGQLSTQPSAPPDAPAQPTPAKSKNDLMALIDKVTNVAPAQAAPDKSDDEIMRMMEDEPAEPAPTEPVVAK